MFVAKVIDGQIANTGKLADMYPNTSFPATGPSDQWMTDNSIKMIKKWKEYDKATQKLVNTSPYLDSGEVYDVQVQDLTAEEIQAKTSAETAKKEAAVRKKRDALLAECDWTVLQDSPLTDAQVADWVIYRQALRDITDHANFPDIQGPDTDGNNSDWPTKP